MNHIEKFPLPETDEVHFQKGKGKMIYFGLESALAGISTGVCFDANFFSQFYETYIENAAVLPISLRQKVRNCYTKLMLLFCLRNIYLYNFRLLM